MLDIIQKRVQDISSTHLALEARRSHVDKGRNKLIHEVKKASDRVNAAPFVQDVLERVQQKEHARAVGAYEELLGAFLSDVLPGERLVSMDLYMERGAPALDIYLQKGENTPKEDALRGTGGSVANLLSTGLRLIALLRSGARRFLVLDESDCWIEPAIIPKYAGVVAEMAETLDVQILMISHHEESLFAGHIPNRLKMVKNGGLLNVEWSPTSEIPSWREEEEGIRSIALHSFQAHQHTFLPLAPRVTLLQGMNDIGKSAVVNSLRAVFYGESSDTLIKHHASSAKVTVDFGPGHLLLWERFRKGKVKVSTQLLKHGGTVLHSSDGTKIPDWMKDATGISLIDGFDVQIGEQKQPVFLLGEAPSVRARALSIGLETGHINTMMALDKSDLNEHRSLVKMGEKQLEALREESLILSKLSSNTLILVEQFRTLKEKEIKNEKSRTLLNAWRRLTKEQASFRPLSPLPAVPEPRNTRGRHLLETWSFLKKEISARNVSLAPPVWHEPRQKPRQMFNELLALTKKRKAIGDAEQKDMGAIPPQRHTKANDFLKNWTMLQQKTKVLSEPVNATLLTPVKRDTSVLLAWKELESERKKNSNLLEHLQEDENTLTKEIDQLFVDCPACGRSW